jgi:hypothetical protein
MTTDQIPVNNAAQTPETPAEVAAGNSWVVAILFWGLILVAGGFYAAVAISPKFYVYLHLRDEHYRTQVELVTLERRVMYLKRVMHALEHDPSFAAEQARVEFGAERPGDERVAVDESLHFAPDPDFDPKRFKQSILPWYVPLVEVFAGDQKTRRGLLIAAGVFSLFAFTFLQESQASQLFACARTIKAGWLKAAARYCAEKPEA